MPILLIYKEADTFMQPCSVQMFILFTVFTTTNYFSARIERVFCQEEIPVEGSSEGSGAQRASSGCGWPGYQRVSLKREADWRVSREAMGTRKATGKLRVG